MRWLRKRSCRHFRLKKYESIVGLHARMNNDMGFPKLAVLHAPPVSFERFRHYGSERFLHDSF